MKQTKPAQAMELRSLSPVFDGPTEAGPAFFRARGDRPSPEAACHVACKTARAAPPTSREAIAPPSSAVGCSAIAVPARASVNAAFTFGGCIADGRAGTAAAIMALDAPREAAAAAQPLPLAAGAAPRLSSRRGTRDDGAGARGRCSKRHGTVLRNAREHRAVEQGDEADER
jgi:hypothetical protein